MLIFLSSHGSSFIGLLFPPPFVCLVLLFMFRVQWPGLYTRVQQPSFW